MYIGAGFTFNKDRIRDKASRDLCPPLNSLKFFFHIPLKPTFSSRPYFSSASEAVAPGSNVLKISPKF